MTAYDPKRTLMARFNYEKITLEFAVKTGVQFNEYR